MSATAKGPKNGRRKPIVVRTIVSMSFADGALLDELCGLIEQGVLQSVEDEAPSRPYHQGALLARLCHDLLCSGDRHRPAVPLCGISSTPGMKGAGLRSAAHPKKRCGLLTAVASLAIEIVEVLVAMTAPVGAAWLISASTSFYVSTTSGTASSTKEASARRRGPTEQP